MVDKYFFDIILNHMVKYPDQSLNDVFHALSCSTRRDIIKQVAVGELSVGDIAAAHDMSLPAVSKHLRVLRRAGLIVQTKQGRMRYCRLNFEPLRAAGNFIDTYTEFWESRFDALEEYLEKIGKEG